VGSGFDGRAARLRPHPGRDHAPACPWASAPVAHRRLGGRAPEPAVGGAAVGGREVVRPGCRVESLLGGGAVGIRRSDRADAGRDRAVWRPATAPRDPGPPLGSRLARATRAPRHHRHCPSTDIARSGRHARSPARAPGCASGAGCQRRDFTPDRSPTRGPIGMPRLRRPARRDLIRPRPDEERGRERRARPHPRGRASASGCEPAADDRRAPRRSGLPLAGAALDPRGRQRRLAREPAGARGGPRARALLERHGETVLRTHWRNALRAPRPLLQRLRRAGAF